MRPAINNPFCKRSPRWPGVTSVVVGARTDAQLKDNLKAVGLVLTSEERARLDSISAPALLYPKQARPPIGSLRQISRYSVRIPNIEPKRRVSVESLKPSGKFVRKANVVPR
jgi:hypothetical protein